MLPAATPVSCSYELDEQFRIVSVDPAWSIFAQENGAPELAAPGPYGRPVLSYISDSTTAHLWGQIYGKVLRTGRPMTVPIRCDSPTARRYLHLVISKRPMSGIRVDSTVVRLEAKPAPLPFDAGPSPHGMLRMCSWCKRAQVEGRWHDAEDLVTTLRLFERLTLPEITHGMCPECHADVMARIGDDR